MDISELSEGLWYIGKIQDGKQISKVAEKVDELPEVISLAQFMPLKNDLYKSLNNLFGKKRAQGAIIEGLKVEDVMRVVVSTIRGKKRILKKVDSG